MSLLQAVPFGVRNENSFFDSPSKPEPFGHKKEPLFGEKKSDPFGKQDPFGTTKKNDPFGSNSTLSKQQVNGVYLNPTNIY